MGNLGDDVLGDTFQRDVNLPSSDAVEKRLKEDEIGVYTPSALKRTAVI